MSQRRSATALLVLAVLAGGAACGGGDGWKPPAKGQATVLFRNAGNGLDPSHDISPLGALYLADDGTLAVYDGFIYTVSPGREVTKWWQPDVARDGAGGLVALPDHSVAVGAYGRVYRRDAKGRTTLLAGVVRKGATRHQPVPASADAATYHFYGVAAPFGRRPDGTLLISDAEAVWALKDGTLTRLYVYPHDGTDKPGRLPADYAITSNTVDGAGNAYVGTGNDDGGVGGPTLDEIRVVHPDGTSAPLAVPARAPGIAPPLSGLKALSMAGGDGESVYVNTRHDNDQYLLRISGGGVTVLAHHLVADDSEIDCKNHQPMQAREIPCALPETITYRNGRLVMGGHVHYFLELAV
ncbi:hypothetical protein [Streptomyces sp. NPDC021020]|uniref:hypothetical protein n=1 Tax=Streptomyces sp. NPDC021020 TaxID=3365109 RepID=UPI003796D94D